MQPNPSRHLLASATLALLTTIAPALYAADTDTPPAADRPWVNAEIRKVDIDAQKLTLRHEAIPNLDMPPMTMVFRVADAALLQSAQVGAKVRVIVDKPQGAYTVLQLEPQAQE